MTNTSAPLLFKLKKALRYTKLYGLSRTVAKIRGQRHMAASEGFQGALWENSKCHGPDDPSRSVAIIGCGNYSYATIAHFAARARPRFLRSAYDLDRRRSLSLCRAYGGRQAVGDWEQIVNDPSVKLVFIASNHASHADYASACIDAGKHVHVEKPHAVTDEQLDTLLGAMKRNGDVAVFLGFNRPRAALFAELQQMLVRESGPMMINWFVAGHGLPPDHWYFREAEGGRVLGNMCHWTDLLLHMVTLEHAYPCTIIAARQPGAASEAAVSVLFADGSCAVITFSAKGHTFEGVREVLNLQRGNLLANLKDFQMLTCDVVDRRTRRKLMYRDHGHEANILHSLLHCELPGGGETVEYVEATGRFVLAIKRAIDSGRTIALPTLHGAPNETAGGPA